MFSQEVQLLKFLPLGFTQVLLFLMLLFLQELFIQALARFSLEQSQDPSSLEYRDLAEIVNTETTLQFLQGV